MIYRAIQLIQIFLADERTDERTNEGNPRGPRGPKNISKIMILQRYLVVVSLTVGKAFPLVVPVSKERLLALKNIKTSRSFCLCQMKPWLISQKFIFFLCDEKETLKQLVSRAQRVPHTRPHSEIFSIPKHARFSFENHRVFWVPETPGIADISGILDMKNKENTRKYPIMNKIPG